MRTAPCFHAYRTCGPTPPTTIVRYAYTQVRCLVAGPNPNPNPNPNPDPNLTQVRYAWWRGDVRGFDAETGLVKVRRPRLTSPRLASPRLTTPYPLKVRYRGYEDDGEDEWRPLTQLRRYEVPPPNPTSTPTPTPTATATATPDP